MSEHQKAEVHDCLSVHIGYFGSLTIVSTPQYFTDSSGCEDMKEVVSYFKQKIQAANNCVVVEDIGLGLAVDKVDGMKFIVTKSGYTVEEGFHNADLVFDFIGDPPEDPNFIQFWSSIYNTFGW